MSEVKLDEAKIERAMRGGLLHVVELATNNIADITPRDNARMPKDPSQSVTWNLKRSIWFEEISDFEFEIWVAQDDDAENYAWHVEFGTPNMEARSYLRKGIIDSAEQMTTEYAQVVQLLLR